jgi:hypothetical protein
MLKEKMIHQIDNHCEKLHISKSHYLQLKLKKNSYIIVVQLSLGYYNYYATIPLEMQCINK